MPASVLEKIQGWDQDFSIKISESLETKTVTVVLSESVIFELVLLTRFFTDLTSEVCK